MKYKMINRDNIDFRNDADVCNIGYFEYYVKNYPIRLEKFYTRGITCLTIFIPDIKEFKLEKDIKEFLIKNNIIKIVKDNIYITEVEDIDDEKYISINVPLEDNNGIINECNVQFKNYD